MQVHVEDIARVESAVGDDKRKGTWIYLRDGSGRRLCDETANKVREMIEEAKSKEEVRLDDLAIRLLLGAANESPDGRLHFTESPDSLSVTAGGVRLEPLQGRGRSKYELAEQQISGHALVIAESNRVYRLNERGYVLAEFLVASRHPEDQPFDGFVKLPARVPERPSQIGVQVNQWNSNTGNVNNAISERRDYDGCRPPGSETSEG